jgi:hypothetical protein
VSRKHNTKHRRGRSNYPARLRARGETSSTVRMTDFVGIDKQRRADEGRKGRRP